MNKFRIAVCSFVFMILYQSPLFALSITGGNLVTKENEFGSKFISGINDVNINGTFGNLIWEQDSYRNITNNGQDTSMFPWLKTGEITWGEAYNQAQQVTDFILEFVNEAPTNFGLVLAHKL